jgi:hypothetical protein
MMDEMDGRVEEWKSGRKGGREEGNDVWEARLCWVIEVEGVFWVGKGRGKGGKGREGKGREGKGKGGC